MEGEGEDEREEEEEEEGNLPSSNMSDDDGSYSFSAHAVIADNPDDSQFLDADDDLQEDSDFDADDLDEEPFQVLRSDDEEEEEDH